MTFLFNFLEFLCQALTFVILARVVLSWFSPKPTNIVANVLFQITEPILAPIRRIIPTAGRLDFSPLIAVVLLQLIGYLLP